MNTKKDVKNEGKKKRLANVLSTHTDEQPNNRQIHESHSSGKIALFFCATNI